MVLMKVGQHRGGWGRVTVWASQGCGADGGTLVRGCEGSGGERGGGSDAGEPHTRATEGSAGGGKKENGGGGEAQNGGGGSGGDGGGGVNGGARTDGDEIDGGEGWGCMAAADARTFVVLAHWHSTSSSATCVRAGTAGVISRAPGGAVLAAAGIAAEYGGELYPRTCPAMSLTPLLAGEAGISATLESGRTIDELRRSAPRTCRRCRRCRWRRPPLLGDTLRDPCQRRGHARLCVTEAVRSFSLLLLPLPARMPMGRA